jgi:uncharacterized protein (TIGR02001 family)
MRKLIKSSLSVALAALMSVSMLSHAGEAVAEDHSSNVSYNIGYMSEYWYRGVYQSDSAVSFGADYEAGMLYAGTWLADVDDGIEFDVYAGISFEMMGMPMYLGATGYYYSDNFDGNYEELNAGVDMGFMALDVAFAGEYENIDSNGVNTGAKSDYEHYTITVPLSFVGLPLDYSYQTFQDELSGFTHELSYGTTVGGADVGLVVGRNSENSTAATAGTDNDTTYATFNLGYSF